MTHTTRAGAGPVGAGDSGFASEDPEDGPLGEDVRDPQGRRADDQAAPAPHGDSGRAGARPNLGVRGLTAAENPARTKTPGRQHAASHVASREAPRRDARPLPEEARTPPAALVLALKWAGVALLVAAGLMALYIGAGLLGELAVRAAYP